MKKPKDQILKNQLHRLIYDDNFKPQFKVYKKPTLYYYNQGEYGKVLMILALFFKNEPQTSNSQRKWFSRKLGEINKILNTSYRPYTLKEMFRDEIIKLSEVEQKEIINYNSPYNLNIDTILK